MNGQGNDRDRLIGEIERETAATARWTGRSCLSARVLAALRLVRREAFVPPDEAAQAWENHPLRIGYGQTISQPFIVAIMTELLDLGGTDRVLEIGTGSGYQAAILARLAAEIYSVERVEPLSAQAARVLAAEGCGNVRLLVGDGAQGWAEHSPYDAIIVTAAARTVPAALVAQLVNLGRMVIPLGEPNGEQQLVRIVKDADGRLAEREVLRVAFVPLI